MKERDLYPIIERWLRLNMIGKSGAVEVKLCKTKSLPYSEIYEHQIVSLLISSRKSGCLAFKLPDEGFSQKPFDIFFLSEAKAFLCIVFYERGSKRFYFIDINDFYRHRVLSDRKSITEDECRELASHTFTVGGK